MEKVLSQIGWLDTWIEDAVVISLTALWFIVFLLSIYGIYHLVNDIAHRRNTGKNEN